MKLSKLQLQQIIKEELQLSERQEVGRVEIDAGHQTVIAKWGSSGISMFLNTSDNKPITFSTQKDVEDLISMLQELLSGPMRTSP